MSSSSSNAVTSADSPSPVADSPACAERSRSDRRFAGSSSARTAANRANAQKSTGPRTKDGKKRSSRNATTHAAFCADLLLPGEPQDLFHALRNALLESLNPQTVLELAMADRIVALHWRLRRLQNRLHILEEADLQAEVQDHNDRLKELTNDDNDEYEDDKASPASAGGSSPGGSSTPQDQHDDFKPLPLPENLSPGFYLARALRAHLDNPDHKNKTSPFERLLTVEQRLQSMLHKAHKELRQLQSERKAQLQDPDYKPCPFITTDNEDANQDPDDNDGPTVEDQPSATDTQPAPEAPQCATARHIPTENAQNEPTDSPPPVQESALSKQDPKRSSVSVLSVPSVVQSSISQNEAKCQSDTPPY